MLDEARRADAPLEVGLEQTRGRRWLIAPGCSIPPDTPAANQTLTPLERPAEFANTPVLSEAEAAAYEAKLRAEGRAVELSDASYRLMARLHAAGGQLEERELRSLRGALQLNGEAALFPLTPTGVATEKGRGVPMEYVQPKEGSVLLMVAQCVTANNDNPKMAQKLAEFLLTVQAQSAALEFGTESGKEE